MTPLRIPSITEFHRWRGLAKPRHPLISVIDYEDIQFLPTDESPLSVVFDFYSMAVKRVGAANLLYGQQTGDFDEGVLFFTAPNQLLRISEEQRSEQERSGWLLLVHPDFIWKTSLASTIAHYDYFSYSVHEALFLSESEELTLLSIIQTIQQEYSLPIDRFSQAIIISQLETLLNYGERFYHRQFLTRKKTAHQMLERLEAILESLFTDEVLGEQGLPTVTHIASELHVSPTYLRGLLKVLTGKSTQEHIHDKLIEKAKEKLSTSHWSISEIAYQLGFEHPQSFSKFFKAKTSQSPQAFKQSFN